MKTILVVDDNEPDLKLIKLVLSGEGYRVLTANSGEEGLSIFKNQQNEIDLILTDILMPRMDGVEFIQNVRRFSPKMKVIFISTYTHRFSMEETPRADFIEKSSDCSRLIEKVHEVLERKGPFLNILNKITGIF